MPFTEQKDREKVIDFKAKYGSCLYGFYHYDKELIKNETKEWKVGDFCFYFYYDMVQEFKTNRRWSTAHIIYKKFLEHQRRNDFIFEFDKNITTAYSLAYMVFFQNHVMPYEREKETLNGTIE